MGKAAFRRAIVVLAIVEAVVIVLVVLSTILNR